MKVLGFSSSLTSFAVWLLVCANLLQPAESFNAIINSNPLTIWLYNYLRANDCLGLPICDLIDGSSSSGGENNVVGTTTNSTDNGNGGGLSLGELYDSITNNDNNAVEEEGAGVGVPDGGGTLGELYDSITGENADVEDREINDNDVEYYDGPDIILYPEETQTTPSSPSDSDGLLNALVHEIDLFDGNDRRRRNRRNLRASDTK